MIQLKKIALIPYYKHMSREDEIETGENLFRKLKTERELNPRGKHLKSLFLMYFEWIVHEHMGFKME